MLFQMLVKTSGPCYEQQQHPAQQMTQIPFSFYLLFLLSSTDELPAQQF